METNDIKAFEKYLEEEKVKELANDDALKDRFLKQFLKIYFNAYQQFLRKNKTYLDIISQKYQETNPKFTKEEIDFIDNLSFFKAGEQLLLVDEQTKEVSVNYDGFEVFKVDSRSKKERDFDNEKIYEDELLMKEAFDKANSCLQFIINFEKSEVFRREFFAKIVDEKQTLSKANLFNIKKQANYDLV